MNSAKIQKFMTLAGQAQADKLDLRDEKTRLLGAQLLLSEVLEYVVHGLGVIPAFNGTPITEPNQLSYLSSGEKPDAEQMTDGLADVAYTMYWNAVAFGIPLEEAFELVCDNNLEKFIHLPHWQGGAGELAKEDWHCDNETNWPTSVVKVEVLLVAGEYFAVGKNEHGKVQKPAHYKSVNLSELIAKAA